MELYANAARSRLLSAYMAPIDRSAQHASSLAKARKSQKSSRDTTNPQQLPVNHAPLTALYSSSPSSGGAMTSPSSPSARKPKKHGPAAQDAEPLSRWLYLSVFPLMRTVQAIDSQLQLNLGLQSDVINSLLGVLHDLPPLTLVSTPPFFAAWSGFGRPLPRVLTHL